MRLNNMSAMLANTILRESYFTKSENGFSNKLKFPLIDITGETIENILIYEDPNTMALYPSKDNILIGSGRQEVTANDYCLESQIDTTNINLTVNNVSSVIEGKAYLNIHIFVINNSSDTINIGGIGLLKNFKSSKDVTNSFLLIKEVLPEVIQLSPHRSVSVTLSIQM